MWVYGNPQRVGPVQRASYFSTSCHCCMYTLYLNPQFVLTYCELLWLHSVHIRIRAESCHQVALPSEDRPPKRDPHHLCGFNLIYRVTEIKQCLQ